MNEYDIQIKVTNIMTVTVEAKTAARAMELAEYNWNNAYFFFEPVHFKGVNFTLLTRPGHEMQTV